VWRFVVGIDECEKDEVEQEGRDSISKNANPAAKSYLRVVLPLRCGICK
jgi:hypothetical protein